VTEFIAILMREENEEYYKSGSEERVWKSGARKCISKDVCDMNYALSSPPMR
jgi:hypothetical protein